MQDYESFVRANWSQAVRACWLITRNVQDAEEAAQDAFVSLYRFREQLRETEKLQPWFYRILMNAAKSRLRKRSKIETVAEQEHVGTDARIEQAALRLAVREAMERLSEEERMALVLCYYIGLTDREGAEAAGWTLGTYKWRLAKAKRQMGKLLEAGDGMQVLMQGEGISNA